ncbi:signal recognition particle receptor FtsY [Terrihabitans soli]|uniref:Signal recognition particle receptor FtsY n=1 Tax=Terrihabitans soli TaxID=708113 RepID=A0A6S6QH59_9HYPH|nr:signal recognition particle-docking protein FtsY [Terrihabitans soli]BCJ89474.1 signal recognition particle receptor FtsY [Terrihabitans soli]
MADEKKPGLFGRFFGGKPAEPEAAPADAELPPPTEAFVPDTAPVILRPEVDEDLSEALAPEVEVPREATGWFARLRKGLSRTSEKLGSGISDLFTKSKFDAATLDELEDLLIQADLGVDAAMRISQEVGRQRHERGLDEDGVRKVVAAEVEKSLAGVAKPLEIDASKKPFVILMAGVNGSGKTTTIGKLAQKFSAEGKKVMLAAGDTFRAAAVEQLNVWAQRTNVPIVTKEIGADASGLAYEAVETAKAAGVDILLIDTAGRLQNRTELMQELEKITRVIKKVDAEAPHAALLVLDATVGQNALSQVELFQKTAGITGLVMTKLDGTARGGILVAVAEKFALPIHFIGVGEGVGDLEPFIAADFSRALVGLD